MKATLLPIACLLATLSVAAHTESDSYQSVNLALTQQSQTLFYESRDKTLKLQGYRVTYQYGIDNWRFNVDYSNARDEDELHRSNGNPIYNLKYDTSAINLFAEYNWSRSWLLLGVSQGQDETKLHYNGLQQIIDTHALVNYDSLTVGTGITYPTQNGQWILSGNLDKQFVNEKNTDIVNVGNLQGSEALTQVNESGVLASIGLNYGHYFPFTERWECYLSAGIHRQITLSGEGRTTTQYHTPRQNNFTTSSELQDTSQSASTSQQLQFSLLHNQGNINFNVDKLSDQNISEAYYSAGFGINF